MRNNLNLNCLYKVIDREDAQYEILMFFSDAGTIHENTLSNVYQSYRFHNDDKLIFKNHDDLGQFALDVCKEVAAPEVFILSTQDYNIGLDTCADIRSFREIFRRYGNIIENPDQNKKKNNIFNKLFN
jgi:predicted amidohydrolase